MSELIFFFESKITFQVIFDSEGQKKVKEGKKRVKKSRNSINNEKNKIKTISVYFLISFNRF